ncbi:MAG: acyl dehydratase [Peptococcaceae bacterium]|nr:MAG: acyl dehydratase [Peptococcaceae bacterium]
MLKEPERYFFEDLAIGDKVVSPGRTVTEADIVVFAGLSADYMPLHTDAEFSKKSIFGERVAHGLLGLIIASGLFTRTELSAGMRETALALLGINSWRFLGPIKIGDTVHVEVEVAEKRETSNPGRGIVTFKRRLINQRGEIVQEGETPMMLRRKEKSNES